MSCMDCLLSIGMLESSRAPRPMKVDFERLMTALKGEGFVLSHTPGREGHAILSHTPGREGHAILSHTPGREGSCPTESHTPSEGGVMPY